MGNRFAAPDKAVSRKSAGHDFLAFYTAGTFVRQGRTSELYDLNAVKAFQREIAARERLELDPDAFGPYWNPPFFACAFAPLSTLQYQTAWTVWTLINIACFGGAMVLLCTILKEWGWRYFGLIPLLTVASLPFIQAIGHGQNTCVSLLLLSATICLWRSGRAVLAGIVCGLLFYKPQLGAIVTAALVIGIGWKALAGLAMTGTALLAATLIALPGTLADFLHKLPANVVAMQVERRYLWERHVTLKSFWRLLLQGYEIGPLTTITNILYIATTIALAACAFAAIWKLRKDPSKRDLVIALTITSMPLLMPFYFDYDLLLLSAAAVLVARLHVSGEAKISQAMLIAWIGLYLWLIVNPFVAGATHVNGTVIALGALSGMLIARAMKEEQSAATFSTGERRFRQAA